MKFLPPEEYYRTLPRKHIGAGALIFNHHGELLIVKPTYKDYWQIPGGVIDLNESPREGVIREVKEEVDLTLKSVRLLCIDYVTNSDKTQEGMQFVFDGGSVDPERTQQIKTPQDEISHFQFVTIERALNLLGEHMAARLPFCLKAIKNKGFVYLEKGKSF